MKLLPSSFFTGVMLSHDNVTYSATICNEHYKWHKETWVSYLPMSHVAPLIIDGFVIPHGGGTTFIADKNALKGTLVCNSYFVLALELIKKFILSLYVIKKYKHCNWYK